MKKFLSLLLSSAMVMSMSAANVMADEATKGTVQYVSADPEAIYVNSTVQYLSPENLKNTSVLIVDGVDVTENCTFERVTNNIGGNGSYSNTDYNFCTKITPPAGTEFAVNKPITYTITNNGSLVDYSTSFTIYELLNDDFENGLNWKSVSGGTPVIEAEADGNHRLALNSKQVVVHNDYTSQKAWKDYTISFELKGGDTKYETEEICNFIYDTSAAPNGKLTNGYQFRSHIRSFINGNYKHAGSGNEKIIFKNGTGHHYKFESKAGNAIARVDGSAFMIDKNIGEARTGAPEFSFLNNGSMYIDNVRVTKMVESSEVEELTFSGIHADTNGVTVYSNKVVDTKVMNNLVTLKDENGTVIPTKIENISNMQYGSNDNFATNNLTGEQSIIKKADGTELEADKVYTIEIASGVLSPDFTAVSKEKVSKRFKLVNVLSDDFSGDLNWQFVQKDSASDKQGTNSVAIENGVLKVTTGSANADNQVLVPANYSDMLELKNSTVEFDLNCVTSPEFIFGFSANPSGTFSDLVSGSGSKSKIRVDGVEASTGRACIYAHFGNPAYHQGWQNKVNGLVANSTHSYKLTGFDTNYNFYMDGNRGYTRTANNGNPSAIGTFAMLFTKTDAVYTLDNVKITRYEEVEELTFSDNVNADTDGITVYPSKDVNVDDMASLVTLKDGNGTTIPVKVEKVENHKNYQKKFSQDKPYVIKKADGNELATDTDYYLTIASGVASNDGAAVSTSAVTKAFKLVNVLTDDFSGDLNWQFVHSNNSVDWQGNNSLAIQDGKLLITMGEKYYNEQRLVPNNYTDMFDLTDCTVKFDFNALNSDNTGNWTRFGFTKSSSAYDIQNQNHGQFHIQKENVRVMIDDDFNYTDGVVNDKTIQPNTEATYKFAGKGTTYTLYKDGIRLAADSETGDNASYIAKGAFAMLFMAPDNTSGYKYTLDNVKITRMAEIEQELKINAVEITADGVSKDSVSGLTTANVVAKIKNTVSQSETATVILGVYDNVSNMTNVVVKENYDLANGATSVDFGDVAINGGTQIKVFVFENLTTLEPLCTQVVK